MEPDRTSEQAVLADVIRLVADVIGEEYMLDLDVSMDSTFGADIGLESVEFVVLGERLRERYGDRVDFAAFIADKELDEIIELTVGQLVRHIIASRGHG